MAYRSHALTSGTYVANMPAGVQQDDYLVAFCSNDLNSSVWTEPSGWTARGNAGGFGSDGQHVAIFDKIATSSEPSTYTWTNVNSASLSSIIIVAFSGRDTSAPRTFGPTQSTAGAASSGFTVNAASGTAAAGDDIAFFVGLDTSDSGAGWGMSTPTNYTERVDNVHSWTTVGLFTRDNVSSGAVGTLNTTVSGGANAAYAAYVVGIAAAAGGGVTLTANAGTLALTGTATALNQSMAAAAGTLALTGTATAFNQKLTAATGTLALTGNAATLSTSAHVTMSADVGTLALTGNAANFTLTGSAVLTADTGLLTLSGNAANLIWSEAPTVTTQWPGPAGASKRRRLQQRRRRYELPNGVHVWATEDEAAEFARQLLRRDVPVEQIKTARQKAGPVTLPAPDVALESDDIVRPYVRRREIPRVDQAFVAYTQRAELADIAFDRLTQLLRRRRRKAALLLLFS